MININANSLKNLPDLNGRFGEFGGRFVAETLMPLILSVEESYEKASKDKSFLSELDLYRRDYIYDIILVLNYNMFPAKKNKGSAIFIHVSNKNYKPTKYLENIE